MTMLKNVAVDYVNDPVSVASNTDDNSVILDMSGFEGVVFIAGITDSVATGVATLTVQANSTSSDTGMTAITSASAQATCVTSDDLNSKILVVDVYRPQERYVQGTITSGTANIAFGDTIAIRYGSRKGPKTQTSAYVADSTAVVGS